MSWSRPLATLIFNEDFDRPKSEAAPPPDPQPAEPVYSAADLQMVRTEALREGHAAGLAEADGVTAALARHALLTIAERLDAARDEAAAVAEELRKVAGAVVQGEDRAGGREDGAAERHVGVGVLRDGGAGVAEVDAGAGADVEGLDDGVGGGGVEEGGGEGLAAVVLPSVHVAAQQTTARGMGRALRLGQTLRILPAAAIRGGEH